MSKSPRQDSGEFMAGKRWGAGLDYLSMQTSALGNFLGQEVACSLLLATALPFPSQQARVPS